MGWEQWIHQIFSEYAFSAYHVYGAICLFMLMSAFGMPIPEEIILVSAGLVAYAAHNPEPGFVMPPDAVPVHVYTTAAVAFVAVMVSDFVIYGLGRVFGRKALRNRLFAKMISEDSLVRAEGWMRRYGYWTVLIFRFTPGVRFPGHLLCGAMGLSSWKFLAMDALAAGISVPTQVILVASYGEYILRYLKQFKLVLFSVLAIVALIFVIKKFGPRLLKTRANFFLFLLVALQLGCTTASKEPPAREPSNANVINRDVNSAAPTVQRVSIVTYNLDQAFNTVHDAGHEDFTFLPLEEKQTKAAQHRFHCDRLDTETEKIQCRNLDWNEETLEKKLMRVTEMIFQNSRTGPDILVLQEVEGSSVVNLLREQLAPAGYKSVAHSEGTDWYGLDCAVFSRLPMVSETKLVPLPSATTKKSGESTPSRGLLEATFSLPDGQTLSLIAVHFPSQKYRAESRREAFRLLREHANLIGESQLVLAVGDFGVTGAEELEHEFFKRYSDYDWTITHQLGCLNCTGTTYDIQSKTWSFSSSVLLGPGFKANAWKVDPKSIRILDRGQSQLDEKGLPKRFDATTGLGASAHLPLYIELEKSQ